MKNTSTILSNLLPRLTVGLLWIFFAVRLVDTLLLPAYTHGILHMTLYEAFVCKEVSVDIYYLLRATAVVLVFVLTAGLAVCIPAILIRLLIALKSRGWLWCTTGASLLCFLAVLLTTCLHSGYIDRLSGIYTTGQLAWRAAAFLLLIPLLLSVTNRKPKIWGWILAMIAYQWATAAATVSGHYFLYSATALIALFILIYISTRLILRHSYSYDFTK